ncbi:MAG TPA: sigma 54-interacting transcriptional regulator [Thermoanaerobaculia bacterium]|nr:sigma 54-interacting transcriptional regulator [Thermoanaerobaculia bacterium]
MLRLVARSGGRIRSFPFPAGAAVIGAAAGNDLVLPFRGVSRRHARLQPLGRDLLLVDLGSKNGLVASGQRLPQVLLSCGGEVGLGTATLTLEEVATSETELGLALAGDAGFAAAPPSTATGAVTPPARSVRAALRLIRVLERSPGTADGGVAPGLAAARPILGAVSLLAFRVAGGEAVIVECHGPVPGEAAGQVLAAAGPGGAMVAVGAGGEAATVLLGAAGTGQGWRLAAVFAGAGPGADAWERDLFDYLAARLGAAAEPPPPAKPPAAGLRLPEGMVPGTSPAALALLDMIAAAAGSRRQVLVLGETGTGKELVARTLHASGPAAAGPFVTLNCAAIPASLAEAELFGVHGRIATGVDPRPGLFVRAQGGTLFLDEIGELPLELQAKILRVLEEREVLPLGAPAPRKLEVRVIAAANRDLAAMVAAGSFRADLYYRLRGFELRVPPLRERRADVPRLAAAFADRAAAALGKRILGISRGALARLAEHAWPGNVRELAAEVERAVLLCPDGGVVGSGHLSIPEAGASQAQAAAAAPIPPPEPAPAPTLEERVAALERETLTAALAATGGNKAAAARALGLTRNGLNYKLARLGLISAHR